MSDNQPRPPMNEHALYGDPGPQSVEMLAAREAALLILGEVLDRKQALDHVLAANELFKALPSRDKAFCRMAISTTLRRLGQIDDLITKLESRPGQSRPPILQNILRLGTAQIAFMAVPDHAAVDTSVRLADGAGMERQKGFVNGVLRNLARNFQDMLKKQDPARLNTPEWLLKIWIDDYELRPAADIATANLSEAPLDISIKDEAERNHWGAQLQASELTTGTLRRVGGGAVHEMPGFDDGMWWVQDAAASIPAQLFGDVKGKTVIDLCAAPGGKTAQLAAMGANVIALDRSAQRLKRLKENMHRLRLEDRVDVVTADASAWQTKEAPEFILLDAPCTATGTIRRHPDVLHLKSAIDLQRLCDIQAAILRNAFDMLAPDGTLIYCTCSLQKAEGEHQIESLLAEKSNAERKGYRAEDWGDLSEMVNEAGDLRILPYHLAAQGGMDGFFISRLTKTQ